MTYRNMRPYYQHYGVEWDEHTVWQHIQELENWDIVHLGQVIGAVRLAFDADGCYLRDLQIDAAFQNQGWGAESLQLAKRIAKDKGAIKLRLRVMKISPAINLYYRTGFGVSHEDERFYFMEQSI
ncbi:GNAT family N-acetyltransferase [Alteromonas sp. MYP5]|uniref:GNAT family N-acetyltransferase n=2 Tax=Alteromonas ponticola TaxID=2720613 RepID=A0ABX1R0R1_9ALTE|nr:GNAT family N-acetyltransferase [Alteromonas ponticola]NMH60060.1 GNAT family N-acetyltransferase [Alteromonas ponticola]